MAVKDSSIQKASHHDSKASRAVKQQQAATESDPALKQRVTALIGQIGAGLYEREEVIAMAFLAVISGQNTFLLGPPGTAKSLISRRLSCAFHQPVYFEHLMSRFTTPEEVFGPVSIKELKQDRYTRKTKGYLPQAEFAFLDEIWKSSPAILNTLLTLINEHIFQNGEIVEEAPLKGLIAASNEVPAEGQSLGALYDRFVVRLFVPPVTDKANFQSLISSKPSEAKPQVDDNLRIQHEELDHWKTAIHDVVISDSCLQIIQSIHAALQDRFDDLGVYVSDRRWQRAVYVMKASAFFNGRKLTNHSDAILLKHCLWTKPENREAVVNLVLKTINDCGFASQANLSTFDATKAQLDEDINTALFHKEAVYKTVTLKGKELSSTDYLECTAAFNSRIYYGDGPTAFTCYIPFSDYKAQETHHPVDAAGNSLSEMEVSFESGSCHISHEKFHDSYSFKPAILFAKGSRKDNIDEQHIKSLLASVANLRGELSNTLATIENAFCGYMQHLDSPFASTADTEIAVSGIKEQIDQVKLRIKDCERLESLCRP